MPSLRIDVSESVVRKLDTERDLLGFESREAYLRWILDHRTSIDTGSDRDRTLSAYADRVEELEAKLEDAEADAQDAGATDAALDADGASCDATDSAENAVSARESDDEAVEHNLAPGEARIADDSVNELATELAGVEGERLDAFAREAVVEMGSQLQGSPESGLTYRSDANLPGADTDRPGEEITDLDELAVPGHDDALVERRRSAVGAALALLREREEARRSDFVDALYDERPAGYETADSWWGCVKRGLRQVDRVRPAGENRRVWQFHTTTGRVTRLPSRE